MSGYRVSQNDLVPSIPGVDNFTVGGNKLPNVSEESGYRSPNPWPENLSQTLLKKLPSGGQSSMDAQSSTSKAGANNKTESEGHFIHTTSSVRQSSKSHKESDSSVPANSGTEKAYQPVSSSRKRVWDPYNPNPLYRQGYLSSLPQECDSDSREVEIRKLPKIRISRVPPVGVSQAPLKEHIDEMNQLLSSNVEENTKPPDSNEDVQVLDAPAKPHPLCIDLTDTHISSISSSKSQTLVDLFERELHTPSRPAVVRTDAADADYFSQAMLDRPPPPVSDADIPSNQLLVQHLPLNESPISAGKKGLFSPISARKKSFLNRTTRAERKNQIQEMKAHKKIQSTSSNLQQALDSDKTMDRAGPSQLQAFPEFCEEKGVFNFLLTVLQSQAQQGKNDIALIDRQMNDLQSKRQSLTDMVLANEQQVARLQSAMNPITDPVSHLSVEQMDQLEKNGLGDMEVFPADSVSHVLVGSKRKRIPIDVGDTAPLGNKGIKRRAMF